MAFERGFKRLAAPQQLKLSSVSANSSTDGEGSPVCSQGSFSFDVLKQKLGVGFYIPLQSKSRSAADWFNTRSKAIEKRSIAKKHDTIRNNGKPVRFLYVFKTHSFSDKSAVTLFNELIGLIN